MSLIKELRFPLIFGLLISSTALIHLPQTVLLGTFDRNAAPQFLALMLVTVFTSINLMARKSHQLGLLASVGGATLVVSSTISLLLSDSLFTSFLGDTGRYAGYASLWALLTIAVLSSTLIDNQWLDFLIGISMGIVLVTLLGLLQVLNLINLPTGAGAGSTLGNLDFLSAWIGTTWLLILLVLKEFSTSKLFLGVYTLISVFVLWKIEAKQGFLDLVIIAVAFSLYFGLRRVELNRINTFGWKAIATFVFLLWSEAIYLIPAAKIGLPGIGDDPQVSIRADFWFSAARIFSNHFGFGVGPDNFGNYYEKYRTLNSIKNTEFVLTNDAHSSMLQSLATLGIFGTAALLVLLLAVIYASIDLYAHTKNKNYLIALLSFFIFYTNSLISPITLPHKAIFWALGGYLLGEDARKVLRAHLAIKRPSLVAFATTSAVVSLLAFGIFLPAYDGINRALTDSNNGKQIQYHATGILPCIAFAHSQLHLVEISNGNSENAAELILRNHPRCLDALSYLAQRSLARQDYVAARPYIYQLLAVAPGRQSVVKLAAIYAIGAGDLTLKQTLTAQGVKLGILDQNFIE